MRIGSPPPPDAAFAKNASSKTASSPPGSTTYRYMASVGVSTRAGSIDNVNGT